MKSIITIQHTESVHHSNGMIGSWTDWSLTLNGISQAERIANRLTPIIAHKPWSLLSSDLLRAKQTAQPIAEKLDIDVQLETNLRERNLGSAVGQSVEWFREHLTPEITVFDRFLDDCESKADVWNRLVPLVNRIINSDESNYILVSHGDTLSILHVLWLGLEVTDLERLGFHGLAGGVSFLSLENEKRIAKRICDMSFVIDKY